MINETKAKVFLCVANTLNFTEAANKLYMTQQAVSKHISSLEDELGFPLLVRSPHNVRLTEAGERCRIFFEDITRKTDEFLEHERELQRRRNKAIRIGYNNWLDFGSAISNAQTLFHASQPDISIIPERQAPDSLQQKLFDDELDIILILKRFIKNMSNLTVIDLTEIPISIICKKEESEKSYELENLSKRPLIINSFRGETDIETSNRAKREAGMVGLKSEKIIVLPNRDSVYTAVELGNGIAIACSNSDISKNVKMISTDAADTLVCVCKAVNQRKLIKEYINILQGCFNS